jgi:DNA-binding transcriptional regulator YiaG
MVVLRRRGAKASVAIETRPVDFIASLKRHGVRLSKGRDALERLLAKQPAALSVDDDLAKLRRTLAPFGIAVTPPPQPATIDVAALRRKLGLSQDEFAARFGLSAKVVRNWEQGRNKPDGPALVLLSVIAKRADAVDEALLAAE